MPRNNIIFLDVDGVLNNAYSMMGGPLVLFDPATVNRLKQIVTFTNARIVLSTAWRLSAHMKKLLLTELEKKGIKKSKTIGQTPDLSIINKKREDEILWWVCTNKDKIKKWVAVDDMNLKKLSKDNFVQTKFYSGLTEKIEGKIISKFIFNH